MKVLIVSGVSALLVLLVASVLRCSASVHETEHHASEKGDAIRRPSAKSFPTLSGAAATHEHDAPVPEPGRVLHVLGFVIDTGHSRYGDQGYEDRQQFVDALTAFLRDVELTEEQARGMLLALYDYQEQVLAIDEERRLIWHEVVGEEQAQGNDIVTQRPNETWQEFVLRRDEVARRIFARWQPSHALEQALRGDLIDALFAALGPERHETWIRYCGGGSTGCVDSIAFGGKFDTISIPGRAHLHTCGESDACQEQREMGIVR